LEKWDENKAPIAERWVQIFSKMEAEKIKHNIFLKATEMVLCLSVTSALLNTFSVMSNVWTAEKSYLTVMTLRSTLMVQVNFSLN
jgi:hypothetical protein